MLRIWHGNATAYVGCAMAGFAGRTRLSAVRLDRTINVTGSNIPLEAFQKCPDCSVDYGGYTLLDTMKKPISLLLTTFLFAGFCARGDAPVQVQSPDPLQIPDQGLDLKTGYPLQLQDAYSIPAGEIRAQSTFIFDRRVGTSSSRGDVFTMGPELQYGVTPKLYLRGMVPVYTGSGPTSTSGDIVLGGFYNFLDETNCRPAMGISADVEIPTGSHSKGLDTLLYYYVSKSIGTGIGRDAIHANIGWIHNSGAYPEERENFYVLRFGYSRMMFAKTLIGLDFVRQKIRQQNITENIIELGFLHRVTSCANLSFTLGVGVADESPDYRIGGGVQLKWH